jgi:hypothetical protein
MAAAEPATVAYTTVGVVEGAVHYLDLAALNEWLDLVSVRRPGLCAKPVGAEGQMDADADRKVDQHLSSVGGGGCGEGTASQSGDGVAAPPPVAGSA